MDEKKIDRQLHIVTVGRDASHSDEHHHPYEPTPYCVLERLAQSGFIDSSDHLIDFGCGKGRVGFYLHHTLGCQITGVEYDPNIYTLAQENRKAYGDPDKIQLVCQSAEQFSCDTATCLYFFNPFTVEILRTVLRNVMDSYYDNPRRIRLFFYYPDDEYLSLLLAGDSSGITDEMYFIDEIDCRDLFPGNDPRERIMVFEIGF